MDKNIFHIVLLLLFGTCAFSQSFDTEFGKNRIQYNNDFKDWWQYESKNFITYWYGKGKNIGHTVIQIAEQNHDEVRKYIEHRINDKIEIIVYTDLSDLKQSNIGGEEIFTSESGETKIVGTKMLIYFDGNHRNLRERIRQGIASVYFASMMFGSNFQEVIQNAVLFNVPNWYKDGFIAYAGNNWNILVDDELRDLWHRRKQNQNFEKFSVKHPRVAGHSMWHFININYGKSTMSNLLYHTRISRDMNKSIEFVLNTSRKNLYREWYEFYKAKFENEDKIFDDFIGQQLKLKNKKYRPISTMSISPDGRYMTYAVNNYGKVCVYLYDFKNEKNELVHTFSFKSKLQEPDYEYPHICWGDNSDEFTFTFTEKDKIYLKKHFLNGEKPLIQLVSNEVQRVYGLSYITNRYYMMNAEVEGYSDLFIYDAKMRAILPISKDYYDDLHARVVTLENKKGILFSSNRTVEHLIPVSIDTLLPLNHFDIFFYELPAMQDKIDIKTFPKSLTRITNTPQYSEMFPVVNEDKVYFTQDESGIINLYSKEIDKDKLNAHSNLSRNIIRHDFNSGKYVYTLYDKGQYKVFLVNEKQLSNVNPSLTSFKTKRSDPESPKMVVVEYTEIPEHLKFQSNFKDEGKPLSIEVKPKNQSKEFELSESSEIKPGEKINKVLFTAAGLKFRIQSLTTRMDNDVLFEGLEIAQGQNNQVSQLPMGFLGKASFTDLFEDYKIEIGARLATSLDGIEYFATYDNNKTLIDKRYAFYMRNFSESSLIEYVPPVASRKRIMMGMYRLKYPLDLHQSIRATSYLRFDKQYYKSTEFNTLNTLPVNEKRLGLRLEYIFDNSFENSPNILHGSRAKFYVEAMNQFNFELGRNTKVKLSEGFTSVIGFDARHYIPILEHSVFALRGTSALSFGNKKNLYYLGGVNNGIFNSFDETVPLPQGQDFAFKTNVPHLRGFKNNIRNGSRYVLTNMELRVPIFRYLLGKERGASFFRNFQLVAFADAGLAWYGASPYSKENPLNTIFIDDVLIDLEIQYFRDPLVVGYGYGIRTYILGYMVKFDLGYGIETKQMLAPRFHFSLGKDF